MLLTELILSKRGPLAKVWLSAHHERKLSKQQTLGVDVEESVDAILTQDEGPTTLRLSGQLMLGVTRIYSRKVQYLLDDCKETKDRISLAFRPGIVDLPEDQIKASKNAITFSDVRNDFDFFDWSWNAPPPPELQGSSSITTSQLAKSNTKEFGAYNFGRPAAPSLFGGSTSRQASHDGETSSHLDSQDFSGIDLDLRLEDFAPGADDSMAIEVGRRQSGVRDGSVRSDFGKQRSSSMDLGGFGGGAGDFEQVDLNLDMDNLDAELLPDLEASRRRGASVASSALSTPPPDSPPDISIVDVTPRTAAKIAQVPDPRADKRAKKPRMVRADQELELDDSYFVAPRADSAILRQTDFMSLDAGHLGGDDADMFLPTLRIGNENMIYAGPAGLTEELRGLFTFPANVLRRDRAAAGTEEEEAEIARQAKRPRIEGEENEGDEDVEAGRRQSTLPPGQGGFDFDNGAGMDDSFAPVPDMDEPLFDLTTPRKNAYAAPSVRAPSLAPSRAESMARQVQYGETAGDYPLAIFDSRTAAGSESQSQHLNNQSQSQQSTPTKSVVSEAKTRGGYSKNTGMAMGLLRRELEAIEAEDEGKKVKFEEISDKASKRAAATFFFELLVLGTRDCIKLEQKKAFGDIEIRGKEKLWDEIAA